jgi:myo-inositol-1(or 4)-monophosphatase
MRKHFGHARIRYKGRANLVTQADVQSQAAILGLIKRRFPSHDYRAEEDAVRETGSEFLWIIDPLDGTTNYAHGYPASCVSIGLLKDGRPLLGGVYDPFREELFFAEKGRGARLNGGRIHVSRVPKLAESLLVTGFAYDRAERSRFYVEQFRRFMVRCHDVRRSGTAALDMAWTAAGRVDGFWELYLNPWDVAAGMLLVEEAGGRVTDFSGKVWTDPKTYGRQTLATNSRIHREMLALLDERTEGR